MYIIVCIIILIDISVYIIVFIIILILYVCLVKIAFIFLQALTILTEMLRDQRSAKLRSSVLPAVGEMMCLIVTQVCIMCFVCCGLIQRHLFGVTYDLAFFHLQMMCWLFLYLFMPGICSRREHG